MKRPGPRRGRKFRVVLVPPICGEALLPLAAGLLKACAMKDAFLRKNAEVIIFEPPVPAEELPAGVAALKPDLAGFTVYGGLGPTREAAAAVKRLCGAGIVFGGPMAAGVPPDEMFAGGTVDYAVEGEGEESFPALLRALLGRGELGRVKGLSCLAGRRAVSGPPAVPVGNLAALPSPYLKGLFRFKGYPRVPLELSRGCREGCLYCPLPKSHRKFPFSRVKAEAARILKDFPDIRTIFLTDPDICLSPDRARLLRLLSGVAAARGITAEIQINPACLKEGEAALFNDRAFSLGVGVQSIFPETCRFIKRRHDMSALERKLTLLGTQAPRAGVVLSFILGLPGDTYRNCIANFDWGLSVNAGLYFHRLRVYPNTPLAKMKGRSGLRFEPRDPYRVVSTPSLDAAGMRRVFRQARGLSLAANVLHADKYAGFLFRYIARGSARGSAFPRVGLCRRLGGLIRGWKDMSAAVSAASAFSDDGDWSGLDAKIFEKARPRLIAALAGMEKGSASRRAFAARYAGFSSARLSWESMPAASAGRILELAAGGRTGNSAMLICGAASSDPARFPGLKPRYELLVEEKLGFFPSRPGPGREYVDRPRLASAAASAGPLKYSSIVVSQVLAAVPPAERRRFLADLLRLAGPGAPLLVIDSGLGYPEFGPDWELTGGWLPFGREDLERDLKTAGWRLVRALQLGAWRIYCAEKA